MPASAALLAALLVRVMAPASMIDQPMKNASIILAAVIAAQFSGVIASNIGRALLNDLIQIIITLRPNDASHS